MLMPPPAGDALPSMGLPPPPAPGLMGGLAQTAFQQPPPFQPPQKKPFFDRDRVNKIVRAAQTNNAKWAAKSKKWRDDFCAGEASPDLDDKTQTGAPDIQENKVLANYTYSYVTILLSVLYSEAPELQVEPSEKSNVGAEDLMALAQAGMIQATDPYDARRLYAEALEDVLTYTYQCGMGGPKNAMALQEALLCGLGVVKGVFNTETGLDDIEHLKREEVYWDPSARFDSTQAKYVVHTVTMPLEEARAFFAAKVDAAKQILSQEGGVGPDGMPVENNRMMLARDFDPALLEANAMAGEQRDQKDGRDQRDQKDSFRFFELWCKDGPERWVYYCDDASAKVSFRLPWPFTLSHQAFPFELLDFNKRGERLDDAFSELWIVDGLKKTYQLISLFLRKYTNRMLAKKLLLDKGLSEDVKAKLLSSATEVEAIEIDNLNEKDPSKMVHVLNFNEGDKQALEMAEYVKNEFNEILGQDELARGGDDQNQMTAREAVIRNNNAHTRLGRKQRAFDDFLSRVFKMRSSIARQKMDPQKVAMIAGDAAGLMWSVHASHPDDFLAQYEVSIAAGSAGASHQQEMQKTLQQLSQIAQGTNQYLVQMQNPPIFDIKAVSEALVRSIYPNADRFFIKEVEQGPAPMQGPPQPGQAPIQGQQGQQGPQQQQGPLPQGQQGPHGPPPPLPVTNPNSLPQHFGGRS